MAYGISPWGITPWSPLESQESQEPTGLDPQVYKGGRGCRLRTQAKRQIVARLPFVWSQTFPFPATSHANLLKYLKMEGISAGTHLWQCEAVDAEDTGSLASGSTFDFASTGTPPSITTDPSYGGGTRNILDFTTNLQALQTSGPSRIPNPMDATKSFIKGGILQWDSFPGGAALYNIDTQYVHVGTKGVLIYVNRTGGDERKLILQFTRGPGFTTLVLPSLVAIDFSTPLAWMVNVDFASGFMKVVTSADNSYAQGAIPGSGTFDPGNVGAWMGNVPSIPGLNLGFVGKRAQEYTLEYDAAIDAGLSQDTMTNFLKYNDGYLTP